MISQINKFLENKDYENLAKELAGMAFYESDYDLALTTMIKFSNHENENVRGNAVLGFAHIARNHNKLSEAAFKIVEKALRDKSSYVRGHADSAVSDIKVFIPQVPDFVDEYLNSQNSE
jgi:3-methyladenine DNA glycosylase AlkC